MPRNTGQAASNSPAAGPQPTPTSGDDGAPRHPLAPGARPAYSPLLFPAGSLVRQLREAAGKATSATRDDVEAWTLTVDVLTEIALPGRLALALQATGWLGSASVNKEAALMGAMRLMSLPPLQDDPNWANETELRVIVQPAVRTLIMQWTQNVVL